VKFPEIALLAKPRPHQVASLGAIGTVLKRNGYRVRETYDATAPEPVVFCWSWGKAMIQRQKHPDSIICTLDHGYTPDRAKLINTGWSLPHIHCGLNGFAEHAIVDDPSRAEKYWPGALENERWTCAKRALLLGQVYGDAMIVTQIPDYRAWLKDKADAMTEAGYTVTFRPHPVMVRRGQSTAYGNLGRLTGTRDLRSDLLESDVVIGLNSNGLVEALLAGVPPIWYNNGSMLSPIQDWEAVWDLREPWFHRLAWAQWHLEELEDGTWFKHHEPIMRRLVQEGTIYPWHDQRLW
jgi:hypothetical protein